MDKKNTTIGVLLLLVAFGSLYFLSPRPQPGATPPPAPAGDSAATPAATAPATTIASAPLPAANATFAALTIPISPVSYGKSAKDFTDLFLLKTVKGAYLVRYGTTTSNSFAHSESPAVEKYRKKRGTRRGKATLEFLFKLSSGVNQTGNPAVVPTNDEFAEVALAVLDKSIEVAK